MAVEPVIRYFSMQNITHHILLQCVRSVDLSIVGFMYLDTIKMKKSAMRWLYNRLFTENCDDKKLHTMFCCLVVYTYRLLLSQEINCQ